MINSWAALESTEAGTGRLITLNLPAFEELVRWASRFPNTRVEHYVFPCCEKRQTDATRPTRGWRTTWVIPSNARASIAGFTTSA